MSRLQSRAPAPERIRFAGRPGRHGYLFELSGGALCLDLANTLDQRRAASPRELLGSYGDLLSWGLQAGALGKDDAARLNARALRQPAEAKRALERARRLRETLFAIFSAAAHQRALPGPELERFNEALRSALAHLRLAAEGRAATWRWSGARHLERVLWPVIRSGTELLTAETLERVRECAGRDCAWLFLDRSRNRTRRWCDMTVCGNREKVRRFRQRSPRSHSS